MLLIFRLHFFKWYCTCHKMTNLNCQNESVEYWIEETPSYVLWVLIEIWGLLCARWAPDPLVWGVCSEGCQFFSKERAQQSGHLHRMRIGWSPVLSRKQLCHSRKLHPVIVKIICLTAQGYVCILSGEIFLVWDKGKSKTRCVELGGSRWRDPTVECTPLAYRDYGVLET